MLVTYLFHFMKLGAGGDRVNAGSGGDENQPAPGLIAALFLALVGASTAVRRMHIVYARPSASGSCTLTRSSH
jgi:hypothetical protein